MKYEKEIDKLIYDLLYESWMSDIDYELVVDETFKLTGLSKDKLSDEIEDGVNNGYSVEEQVELLKQMLC